MRTERNMSLQITYRPSSAAPTAHLVVDGARHEWTAVWDAMVAKINPKFDPNRPDPVFDSLMKAREEARNDNAKRRNENAKG